MKVALVTRAIHPLHMDGGLERHAGALKRHLERAGCDVLAVTTPPESEAKLDDSFRVVPYRAIEWPRGKGFVVLDRITNYLMWSLKAGRSFSGFEPDIVQADGGAGFGVARAQSRSAPPTPPLVLHPHGMEEFKTTPAKRALYWPLRSAIRYAARHADGVIAPDQSMEPEVREILSVPPERIRVLPNAIDLDEVDAHPADADLSSLGIDEADTVLLSVGRLESNKGFVDLAEALGRRRNELPERWRWVLVGSGPERETIETAVNDRAVAERVRFAGRVSDDVLFSLYRRADVFVHPTLYEGSSMVTLEAMARETAVVASRVGGIPDKVTSGQSGLLVRPGDIDALGRALLDALSDRDRLAEWGRAARRTVEERFAWSRRIADLLAMYESLIEANQHL